eukprot:1193505-Prorocentrum_minimum.AAC.3
MPCRFPEDSLQIPLTSDTSPSSFSDSTKSCAEMAPVVELATMCRNPLCQGALLAQVVAE